VYAAPLAEGYKVKNDVKTASKHNMRLRGRGCCDSKPADELLAKEDKAEATPLIYNPHQ
jgi:hypothetical protein